VLRGRKFRVAGKIFRKICPRPGRNGIHKYLPPFRRYSPDTGFAYLPTYPGKAFNVTASDPGHD